MELFESLGKCGDVGIADEVLDLAKNSHKIGLFQYLIVYLIVYLLFSYFIYYFIYSLELFESLGKCGDVGIADEVLDLAKNSSFLNC